MTRTEQAVLNELCSLMDQQIRIRYFRQKNRIDRVLAALMLVPGLPVIGLFIVLVRLTSKGPGIFRQTRVGQGGHVFTMYKIRTMRLDAERRGPVWAKEKDPRITVVGRVLRKLHLDELPQLLNVVKGDMSLIGPRPERPEFVAVLAESIPNYHARLAVLPGVTGLAQINLPPDEDLDSVRRKQVLDVQYIETAGYWLDARVLACTFLRLIGIKGLLPAWLLGLRRDVYLDASHYPDKPHAATGSTPDDVARQALESTAEMGMDDTVAHEDEEPSPADNEASHSAHHNDPPQETSVIN